MRGSAHLAIGLITGVAIAGLVPGIPFSLPGIALAGFSALAPDLDHPESRLSKRLGFTQGYVRWAFGGVALVLAAFAYFQLRPGPDQRLSYTAALAFGLIGVALQGGSARRLALRDQLRHRAGDAARGRGAGQQRATDRRSAAGGVDRVADGVAAGLTSRRSDTAATRAVLAIRTATHA